MNLYLVRHTPPLIDDGVCYGQTDLLLKDGYEADFDRIKRLLPANPVVYSSPLLRCTQLAESLNYSSLHIDDRIMEMHFGKWEQQAWSDIDAEEMGKWMNDFVHQTPPSGESFYALHERSVAFLKELEKHAVQDVVLVTHAGVIRSLLCHLSQTPLHYAFRFEINYGSITKCSIQNQLPIIHFTNRHW